MWEASKSVERVVKLLRRKCNQVTNKWTTCIKAHGHIGLWYMQDALVRASKTGCKNLVTSNMEPSATTEPTGLYLEASAKVLSGHALAAWTCSWAVLLGSAVVLMLFGPDVILVTSYHAKPTSYP
eukprot:scaffold86257_cov19-Tisochrysis_lutea.AAC.1